MSTTKKSSKANDDCQHVKTISKGVKFVIENVFLVD